KPALNAAPGTGVDKAVTWEAAADRPAEELRVELLGALGRRPQNLEPVDGRAGPGRRAWPAVLPGLRRLHQPDKQPVRVVEHGDGEGSAEVRDWHDGRGPERVRLVKDGLQIRGLDVEGRPRLPALALADPAVDAAASLGVDQGVAAAGHRLQVPSEQLPVEID